jgi:hypothetical protein
MRRGAIALGWSAVALVASCEQPRTELVVRVDSELAWGPGQRVQSVVLVVRRAGASGLIRSARTTVLGTGGERRALPFYMGVIPADDDIETPLWLEALGCDTPSGCRESTAVLSQRALVRFTRGQTQEVRLLLVSACVGRTCALDERCGITGRCEPATRAQNEVVPFGGVAPPREDVPIASDASADIGSNIGGDDVTIQRDGEIDGATDVNALEVGTIDVVALADRPDGGVLVDALADLGVAPLDGPASDLVVGACTEGTTRPCYTGLPATRSVGLCSDGFQRCAGGHWSVECNGETRPQVEVCNTIDDDCDGTVDNIQTINCYSGPPGTRGVGICHEGMQRCDGAMAPRCIGQMVPESREVCANGRDDNCNGMTDEAGCL